jgi:hypothetical protein
MCARFSTWHQPAGMMWSAKRYFIQVTVQKCVAASSVAASSTVNASSSGSGGPVAATTSVYFILHRERT